jgi:hypothetical protein
VIDDELAAAGEEFGERDFSARRIEAIILVHAYPREVAAVGGELVVKVSEFLFLEEEFLAFREPLLARDDGMMGQSLSGRRSGGRCAHR